MYILIIIFVVGVAFGIWFARRKGRGPFDYAHGKSGSDLISRQMKEKADNLEKILAAFDKSPSSQGMTNDDIQKLIGVSDATVTRYMDELEKEGKVRQVGATGKYVYYTKV